MRSIVQMIWKTNCFKCNNTYCKQKCCHGDIPFFFTITYIIYLGNSVSKVFLLEYIYNDVFVYRRREFNVLTL